MVAKIRPAMPFIEEIRMIYIGSHDRPSDSIRVYFSFKGGAGAARESLNLREITLEVRNSNFLKEGEGS